MRDFRDDLVWPYVSMFDVLDGRRKMVHFILACVCVAILDVESNRSARFVDFTLE